MSKETITIDVLIEESVILQEKVSTKGYWDKSHYVSRGNTGHWTKWGGARMDLIQEGVSDIWFCQSCNDPQPKDLTPYRFEFIKDEYIRICAKCLQDGCIALRHRVGWES